MIGSPELSGNSTPAFFLSKIKVILLGQFLSGQNDLPPIRIEETYCLERFNAHDQSKKSLKYKIIRYLPAVRGPP